VCVCISLESLAVDESDTFDYSCDYKSLGCKYIGIQTPLPVRCPPCAYVVASKKEGAYR
jgi:hypothetical protein